MPIPLAQPNETISREQAREQLGIPSNQIVLLSVGRAVKYQPNPTHDFFATTRKILEYHPDAHLYIVGLSEPEAVRYQCGPIHTRVHPVGSVEDPSVYRKAADIYLESFPFGSQTALLESALAGIPIVPALAPPLKLIATDEDAIADLVTNPKDENEYIYMVSELMDDPDKRRSLGSILWDRMHFQYTGAGWRKRLKEVYEVACALKHEPRPIPFSQNSASETDRALSAWQASILGGFNSKEELTADIRQLIFDAAYHARQDGDYRAALDLLLGCCHYFGGDGKIFKSLAKLPFHWVLNSLHFPKTDGCPRAVTLS